LCGNFITNTKKCQWEGEDDAPLGGRYIGVGMTNEEMAERVHVAGADLAISRAPKPK